MLRRFWNCGITPPGRRVIGPIICLCICLTFVIPVNTISAQQRSPEKKNEAELVRKTNAIDLVLETADSARMFKDLFYRARIQTLSADLLWPYDEARARAIFRRAWEAATAYDKSEEEAEDRESGVPSTLPITEARDEVLTKAAARDSKLGEEFLSALLSEKRDENTTGQNMQTRRRTPWRELSAAGQHRLALAYELLRQNQPNRAADIASRVINEGASGDLMAFITRLREVDNRVGDAYYQRLIESSKLTRDEDTNTVLLLSSQIVSPWLLIVVDERGSLQFRRLDTTLTGSQLLPFVSPTVRLDFYSFASSSLLRPQVPSVDQNELPEAVARYIAIGRLLPYFEREAPQHVANLRMRLSTLSNDIESGRRDTLNAQIEMNTLTPKGPGDALRPQLDQLGRARDAKDRDRIALGIVKKAAQKRLWDRARRGAMEIEDLDFRRSALSYIAACQIADLLRAFADDKEENVDRLAKFVRSADVPPLVIAWGLAQTAIMAKRKGDLPAANALLDEAVTFAARTPAGTWQRVAAYTAVARLAVRIDVKRAWEILPEVVRAANALDDFAGDEESIDIAIGKSNADDELEPLSVVDNVFQIDGLFAAMAQVDHEKALTAAFSLGRETPKAFASLAIARKMLETGRRTQGAGHSRKTDLVFYSVSCVLRPVHFALRPVS